MGSGATICYEKLGFAVRALVEISIRSHLVDRTVNNLLARPEVLEATVVSGKQSIVLNVIARSMEQLHRFVHDLQELGDTETRLVFSTHKSKLSLKDRL
jgi:Lrp/AsnC family leucine-responsive transcriptional regulator